MQLYKYKHKYVINIKLVVDFVESDGYGSKGSKLFSLIFKNEAISITLIRISLSKGI
jgi:hypothetical protein